MSEIRIGAGDGGQSADASAFSVSRDSGGILIGARDNAAPQFGVERDSDGILVSVRETTPPLPWTYTVSGYVLGTGVANGIILRIVYLRADFSISGAGSATITTSLTEWQRVSATLAIPSGAVYVMPEIHFPRESPAGAYWTAMQLEGGAVAGAYNVGETNLLLNPEFASDLSYWSRFGLESLEISDPLYAVVFSRAANLPSSPIPGVTTGLMCSPYGYNYSEYFEACHRTTPLPTP